MPHRAEFLDEWRSSTPEAYMLVEKLAVATWRFYYVNRLMEMAMRHPDPKVALFPAPAACTYPERGQPACAYTQTAPENPPLPRWTPSRPLNSTANNLCFEL